jgi:hypothetical protein
MPSVGFQERGRGTGTATSEGGCRQPAFDPEASLSAFKRVALIAGAGNGEKLW